MKKIYLIRAKAQSGKNTVAEIMKEQYEAVGQRVLIIAFGDYVKFILDKYYGIKDTKSEQGRTYIQHYATDFVRSKEPDFWANVVSNFLKIEKDNYDIILIPDWRFHNEKRVICDNFANNETEVITIEIIRKDYQSIDHLTETQRQHLSEIELDNYNFDYTIINETNNFNNLKLEISKIIMENMYD